MTHKKEYRSAIRSRRRIREVFLELLKEKEFEKITVTDIANRADLNRSTFYAHYPDIYGVVEEIQDEIVNKNIALVQQTQYRNILKNPMPYLQSISAALEENLAFYKKTGHTFKTNQLLNKYKQMMMEDLMNNETIPKEIHCSAFVSIQIHFFLGGIMNSYQQWVEGTLDCTLNDISEEIAHIIQKSASEFIDADWLK